MSTLHDIRSAAHARAGLAAAQAVWDNMTPDDGVDECIALESASGEIIQELLDAGALTDFCGARLDGAEWVEIMRQVASALAAGPGDARYAQVMDVLGPHIDTAAEERLKAEAADYD